MQISIISCAPIAGPDRGNYDYNGLREILPVHHQAGAPAGTQTKRAALFEAAPSKINRLILFIV
jgi:hypothetical protein